MWRLSLVALAPVTISSAALAGDLGRVTKFLRPTVHTFDADGQPVGTLNASDVKLPAAIVGLGKGKSIGIKVNGKTTVDWKDPQNRFTKGHFALQQHNDGSEVRFRKIEVLELPADKKE